MKAQADLNLRWEDSSDGTFSDVTAHVGFGGSPTFGTNKIHRQTVVQNMTKVDSKTKFNVVCSVGKTWAKGTPNAQTVTTL